MQQSFSAVIIPPTFRLVILSCLVFSWLSLLGCSTSPTRQSLDYGQRFDHARRSTQKRINVIKQAISHNTRGLLEDLSRSEVQSKLGEIGERVYDRWRKINLEIGQAKEDLEVERKRFQESRQELDRIVARTSDRIIKVELEENHRRAEAAWQEEYRRTLATLNKLEALQIRASDINSQIVSAAICQDIEQSAQELRNIRFRVEQLAHELEENNNDGLRLTD